MSLDQQKKLAQIEDWLKLIQYPHLPKFNTQLYVNAMVTGTESRINVLEYLVLKYSQTLFALISGDNDYTNMDKRIYCIKSLLLQSGLWGQSKFGRNVDLNKLIEGLCSFEMSLKFLYKITKKVYYSLNQKKIYLNIEKSQEMRQLQMEQYHLFLECMKNPHQMINPDINPFPPSFPFDEDHIIHESQEILEQEVLEDYKFLKQQHDKLDAKLQISEEVDLQYVDSNILEMEDISKFVSSVSQLNEAITKYILNYKRLTKQSDVLEGIKIKNNMPQHNSDSINFPKDYLDNMEKFNQLKVVFSE